MLTPKEQDEFDRGILPTSPEQLAAGMQTLLKSKLDVSALPLGSLPEGTLFRFHHGVVTGVWRVGKPDTAGWPDPRCYRVDAETSNKPFDANCKVVVVELPPAPDSLVIGKQHRFRTGDVVKHEPSTEEWVLATDEHNGRVWTYGWPESPANVDELSLIEAASDESRLKSLRDFAKHDGPRGSCARAQLEAEPVDPFDSADFYDCGQSPESLNHKTPAAAILALFPDDPDAIDAAELLARGPLTVAAYRHVAIPDEWFSVTAERLADFAGEAFDETELLANPDGDEALTAEQLIAGAKLLEPALREMFANVKPWHCEQVATREYSAAEVEAILRERKPERFAKESTG
jgi:hypothetical protein